MLINCGSQHTASTIAKLHTTPGDGFVVLARPENLQKLDAKPKKDSPSYEASNKHMQWFSGPCCTKSERQKKQERDQRRYQTDEAWPVRKPHRGCENQRCEG